MTTSSPTPETQRRIDGSVDPYAFFTKKPFISWIAIVFYALAAFLAIAWFNAPAPSRANNYDSSAFQLGVAALSSFVTGTVLGAVGRMIMLLQDIRDQRK